MLYLLYLNFISIANAVPPTGRNNDVDDDKDDDGAGYRSIVTSLWQRCRLIPNCIYVGSIVVGFVVFISYDTDLFCFV